MRGLGSIPPVRGNFIRPLIDCTKSEIEEYCFENGIGYVTDKSNSDTDKDTAIAFTEELLGEKDYRSITAERKKDGDGYLYVVTAVYGKTIYTE